jgi:hypothetical protein
VPILMLYLRWLVYVGYGGKPDIALVLIAPRNDRLRTIFVVLMH